MLDRKIIYDTFLLIFNRKTSQLNDGILKGSFMIFKPLKIAKYIKNEPLNRSSC